MFLACLLRRTSGTHALKLSSELTASTRAALSLAGQLVYTRGLLRKGVGLCHGVSGSVFALLALDSIAPTHAEGEQQAQGWLERAVHLAHLATTYEKLTAEGEMDIPDRRYSLYEGVAGMCCAWAEVLKRMEGGGVKQVGMPGFDDLF